MNRVKRLSNLKIRLGTRLADLICYKTSLKAGNFTIYVEKATKFSPGLRFNAGVT